MGKSAPTNRATVNRIIGILMIVIAVINLATQFVVFSPTGQPQPQAVQPDELGAEAETLESEIVQDVGGLTSTMGMATTVISLVMIVIGVALLMNAAWEMFAMLALGADSAFKLALIISQAVAGEGLLDAVLVPLIFIVVESVMIYFLYRTWNARKHVYEHAAGEDALPLQEDRQPR